MKQTSFIAVIVCLVFSCISSPGGGPDPTGLSTIMTGNTTQTPDESDFHITVLDQNLEEPMEFDIFSDGRILFVERRGKVKIYDPSEESTRTISNLPVQYAHVDKNYEHKLEDGLLGVAIDPDYDSNSWVYIYYSPVGEKPKQNLSRFELDNDSLHLRTEKVMLEVPVQRDECCHSGGSLEFGPDGNLFISIGDNTNPFNSDGFAPIDERPSRLAWDVRRSSSNTNDLRGKILRIRPEDDGSYTIPEGNLFFPGRPDTRPEIYVMGCRNPFRISIDPVSKFVYWGEIGPDSREDKVGRGPMGYDEINQARSAGYFGWPLFVANNKPYNRFTFEDSVSGLLYKVAAPVNDSPNNTGLKHLPEAQPAFIWYSYGGSTTFPLTGVGGRNAMAGPVYHYEAFRHLEGKFPKYYDGKLFIYDWMRGWVMTVTMDEKGDYVGMQRFMPSEKFHNPMDMIMWKDGALYILEYGTRWYTRNEDARLLKIEYRKGENSGG